MRPLTLKATGKSSTARTSMPTAPSWSSSRNSRRLDAQTRHEDFISFRLLDHDGAVGIEQCCSCRSLHILRRQALDQNDLQIRSLDRKHVLFNSRYRARPLGCDRRRPTPACEAGCRPWRGAKEALNVVWQPKCGPNVDHRPHLGC